MMIHLKKTIQTFISTNGEEVAQDVADEVSEEAGIEESSIEESGD